MNKENYNGFLNYFEMFGALSNLYSLFDKNLLTKIGNLDEKEIGTILGVIKYIIRKDISIEGFERDEQKNSINDILNILDDVLNKFFGNSDDNKQILKQINDLKAKLGYPKKSNNYLLNDNINLFNDQKIFFQNLDYAILKRKNIIISAPTSFGKSFMMREIILKKNMGNFFFIVPTISLQNEYFSEFYKKLLNKDFEKKIYIGIEVVNDHDFNAFNKNIFILTQEKMLSFIRKYENSMLNIDYVVFDEFQEFIMNPFDSRGSIMYSVIEFFNNFNTPHVFAMPLIASPLSKIKKVLQNIEERNYVEIISKIDYSLKDFYLLKNNSTSEKWNIKINDNNIKVAEINEKLKKDHLIKKIIETESNNTTIVFSQKSKIKKKNYDFFNLNSTNFKNNNKILLVLNYIKNNLADERYYIYKALENGVAIHHSDIDFYLKKQIEFLYKNKIIKCIFTTETLAHGVNLNATNFIFDANVSGSVHKSNSRKELTYKNLIGRVGRINNNRGKIFLFKEDKYHKMTKKVEFLDLQLDIDIDTNLNMIKEQIKNHKLISEQSILKMATNFSCFPINEDILKENNYSNSDIQDCKNNEFIYDSSPVPTSSIKDAKKWINDEHILIKKLINANDIKNDSFFNNFLNIYCEKIWNFYGRWYFKKGEATYFIQTLKNKFYGRKLIEEVQYYISKMDNGIFWHRKGKDFEFYTNSPPNDNNEKYQKYNVHSTLGYSTLVDYLTYVRKRYLEYGYTTFISDISHIYEVNFEEKLFEYEFEEIRNKLSNIGIDSDLINKIIINDKEINNISLHLSKINSYKDLIEILTDKELKWIIETCFE
ncbi:DEAD/DEAH box helicase [Spiroplasma cantharicola]|uniref:Antiviral helicase SKI2 n=1 Tax=Spiroplasma cantharicola TaxID=362837 RepID=A0A0M4KCF2_9MOLU|nr:DEAD/DEAH box helicase [Spiroplasma cantharicola]ALD66377.1 antiviral helicase SKI2 [Spiroplasma cantharicola]